MGPGRVRRSICYDALMRRLLVIAAFAACASLFPRLAGASGSIGGDWTTGNGYRGFDVKGDIDLDSKGDWNGAASYAYAHSKVGTESRSNQFTVGINHVMDEQWSSRFGFTGWEDTLNEVKYAGPSFGITYTEYDSPEADSESYRVAFDNDFFLYKADQSSAARRVKVGNAFVVIPANQGDVSLGQWHPSMLFEKPVQPWLIPWAAISHSFYSKNPSLIEDRAGRPAFSSSSGALNGLVGGLFNNTGQLGVDFKLPAHLRLSLSLGVEQQASDNTWSTTQNAGLTGLFFDHWRAKVSWSRSIQNGLASDLVTAGSSWLF